MDMKYYWYLMNFKYHQYVSHICANLMEQYVEKELRFCLYAKLYLICSKMCIKHRKRCYEIQLKVSEEYPELIK